jgi:hypothetical protein
MSLRARDQKVFFVSCDAEHCDRPAPAGLTPVEAEVIARNAGWSASPDLRGHRCDRCAPREAPVETPLGEQIDQGFEVDLEGL